MFVRKNPGHSYSPQLMQHAFDIGAFILIRN